MTPFLLYMQPTDRSGNSKTFAYTVTEAKMATLPLRTTLVMDDPGLLTTQKGLIQLTVYLTVQYRMSQLLCDAHAPLTVNF